MGLRPTKTNQERVAAPTVREGVAMFFKGVSMGLRSTKGDEKRACSPERKRGGPFLRTKASNGPRAVLQRSGGVEERTTIHTHRTHGGRGKSISHGGEARGLRWAQLPAELPGTAVRGVEERIVATPDRAPGAGTGSGAHADRRGRGTAERMAPAVGLDAGTDDGDVRAARAEETASRPGGDEGTGAVVVIGGGIPEAGGRWRGANPSRGVRVYCCSARMLGRSDHSL